MQYAKFGRRLMSIRFASAAAVVLLAGACHVGADAEERDPGPEVSRSYQVGAFGELLLGELPCLSFGADGMAQLTLKRPTARSCSSGSTTSTPRLPRYARERSRTPARSSRSASSGRHARALPW